MSDDALVLQAGDAPRAGGAERAHVAILGAGLMGSQIGCEYALGGWRVSLIVRDRARAEQRVETTLALALAHRLADEAALARARALISYADSSAIDSDASSGGARASTGDTSAPPGRRSPELIVESLPEDLSLKGDVLGTFASRHPDAIVASNTSSISTPALGDAAGVSERIVGTHYWNPPLLMPLVETIAGEHTPRELLVDVIGLLRAIGKRPVVIERGDWPAVEPAAARRAARVRVARRARRRFARDDRSGDARRAGAPLAPDRAVRDGRARRRSNVRCDRSKPLSDALVRDARQRLRASRAARPGRAREAARAARRGARGRVARRTRSRYALLRAQLR